MQCTTLQGDDAQKLLDLMQDVSLCLHTPLPYVTAHTASPHQTCADRTDGRIPRDAIR
jgi:hypothetical protein